MKSTLGIIYYWNGRIDFAYKIGNEAMQTAEESRDLYVKALSHTGHGISCLGKGNFPSAIRLLLKAANFCERAGNPFWNAISLFNLGESCLEMREYGDSEKHYNEAANILYHNDLMPSFMKLCEIASIRAKSKYNKNDIDLELVFNSVKENKSRIFNGWIARYAAEILLNIDVRHNAEAEHWLKKAMAEDRKNDMPWHLGRDYALYADLHQRTGDMVKAKENLGIAIDTLNRCGADSWVEKYRKELALLA
jgi:tetratricopeptide (TPR) repeat protein